jgi:S1-C subfamily serine protease
MLRSITLFGLLLTLALPSTGQQQGKLYFDKYGRKSTPELSYYYRNPDSAGYYRSNYTLNDKPYFEGRITTASEIDENQNVYSGTCKWYYRNGNLRSIRMFGPNGKEDGRTTHYYESGKLWKEVDYESGHIRGSTYTEYNEDGVTNRIFEEHFDNNYNEWDLYDSEKSSATIAGGQLLLTSFSKAGTSRYINHFVEAGEYSIEASINTSQLKEDERAGLIYGFKDWQNYHYFAISKKHIYLGSFYEGVKTSYIDGMFCSNINASQNNVIKVISDGDKDYYSVNGEIQYKNDRSRLFGNNFGFVTSSSSKMSADRLMIKEINIKGGTRKISPSGADKDVKATGSGIIFSPNGYILTNYHVVDNSNRFVVELNENGNVKNLNAEVVIHDKVNDLAILKIRDDEFTSLPLLYAFKDNGLVDVGASVFTIGYPHALSGMGKEAKFTDGRVSSKTGYNGNINAFQTTIPVQPGNSGGPVFNSDGQLIGVINATFKEADNVSYAIKLNYIKNLIELMNEKVEPPSNNTIQNLSLEEKLKVLTNYVVLIKVK